MTLHRSRGPARLSPFPVHEDLVERLLAAHAAPDAPRDEVVAHALSCCAGYAYADLETVVTIASRVGLEECAGVRLTQVVDAMLVFSTAYLLQSRCGRVVILCYRGTEPSNLGNWLGDADVGSDSMVVGRERLRVPEGFHRNMRATRWAVLKELGSALECRSLGDPAVPVDHPMEALYVTGHSLGGAMAVLFALSIAELPECREIADRLRAVYTFGQPLTSESRLPAAARELGRRLHRHVLPNDPVPAIPPASWCRLDHFGREWRFADGGWTEAPAAVTQLKSLPRALIALAPGNPARRTSSIREHAPDRYLAALQPANRVTELGDRACPGSEDGRCPA